MKSVNHIYVGPYYNNLLMTTLFIGNDYDHMIIIGNINIFIKSVYYDADIDQKESVNFMKVLIQSNTTVALW